MKKRILGAIILVALAAIFIPMLLEEKIEPIQDLGDMKTIPKAPDPLPGTIDLQPVEPVEKIEIQTIEDIIRQSEDTATQIEQPTNQDQQTTTSFGAPTTNQTTENKPGTQSQGPISTPASYTKSWNVQVGSFAQYNNAENMIAKLKLKGMDAYIAEYRNNEKKLYRVRIGPLSSRNSAQQQLNLIEKDMKIKGTIVAPE